MPLRNSIGQNGVTKPDVNKVAKDVLFQVSVFLTDVAGVRQEAANEGKAFNRIYLAGIYDGLVL